MRLTLHLTREQRVRLEQAAALAGQPLNEFLLDHAVAAADAVLRARPPGHLRPEQFALTLDTEPATPAEATTPAMEPRRTLWD